MATTFLLSQRLQHLLNQIDPLQKGCGWYFYQMIAPGSVDVCMDILKKERFLKCDFSDLGGLTEARMFEKEDLSLINVLALNALQLCQQTC